MDKYSYVGVRKRKTQKHAPKEDIFYIGHFAKVEFTKVFENGRWLDGFRWIVWERKDVGWEEDLGYGTLEDGIKHLENKVGTGWTWKKEEKTKNDDST